MIVSVATVDVVKDMLGVVNQSDDDVLEFCFDSAYIWVCGRVLPGHMTNPDVQYAIALLASRLYKRRQSPEGVAGWGELGVVRVMREDPDIRMLLEHHLDTHEGVLGLA
jgi:hypothetical protein